MNLIEGGYYYDIINSINYNSNFIDSIRSVWDEYIRSIRDYSFWRCYCVYRVDHIFSKMDHQEKKIII